MSALALAFLAPAAVADDGTPDAWDRRVGKYVRFVERERGLEFEHPVRVRFLRDAAFREAATAWYDDSTDTDRERAEQESADLLALGLVTEPFDVLAASESSDTSGTLGWYDDERKVMVVRGTDVADTEVQLTIVHELTHALQDQHFDFDDLYARARTSGEYAGIGALVEGDATLVEQAYLWSLPEAVREAYWNRLDAATEATAVPEEGAGAAWPNVYDLWSAFDYDLAPTALEVAIAAHGRDRVDDLFRTPPRSEEAFVDPVALEDGDEPRRVTLPRFGPGEEPRGDVDDFGAFSLYLVLASRVPWPLALQAVEGWGGDRYRSYVRTVDGAEQGCVRLAVTGDTDDDTAELEGALATWAAAMPVGAARVERAGARVVLSACAIGVAPASADDAMQTAYDRLWERTDGMWYLTDPSLPPGEYTRCVADALVGDPTAQPLLASEQELRRKDQRILEERVDALMRGCS